MHLSQEWKCCNICKMLRIQTHINYIRLGNHREKTRKKRLILNRQEIHIVKYVLLLIFIQHTFTKCDNKYNPLATKTMQNLSPQTHFPIEKTDAYKHKVQNAFKPTCFSPISVCTCLGKAL